MTNLDEARELVARSCRILGKLNMTKEPSGHVSARIAGSNTILIKARGRGESGLRFVTERDLITVDIDGKKLEGRDDLAVPQEVFIHTWIYRARPDVGCVIHVHPATVVLFTICDLPILPLFGAYDPSGLRLAMEGVPTYPRSVLIANDKLGKELAASLGKQRACLMRGHGITAVGPSVQEATLTAIRLNELAEINYRGRLLGNPRPISKEDMETFSALPAEGRKSSVHTESAWRYYCNLLDEEIISPPGRSAATDRDGKFGS
ncbi:MAG TPA: class II aldolase/adducin family protein [Candidatus Binatia bacterium]|jgi:L-fuculose-phosphate aldolase